MPEKHSYKLRVNIHGFSKNELEVHLLSSAKDPLGNAKIRVQLNAKHAQRDSHADPKVPDDEASKTYSKIFEILSKHEVVANTMRHYVDPANADYLIVEFASNANEDTYVNLSDSCDTLVEAAARTLANFRNIEEFKNSFENPFNFSLTNLSAGTEEKLSPETIRDLNAATSTAFSQVRVVDKQVRVQVSVPHQYKSAGLESGRAVVTLPDANSAELIEDLAALSETLPANHLSVRCDGLRLSLDGVTKEANCTSRFTKEFNLPKGTLTSGLKCAFDAGKHVLVIEAPFTPPPVK